MEHVPPAARDGAVAGLIASAGALLFALVLGFAWDGLPRLGLGGLVRPGEGALALGLTAQFALGAGLGVGLFALARRAPAGALTFSVSAAVFCLAFLTGEPMAPRTALALLGQHLLFAIGLSLALPAVERGQKRAGVDWRRRIRAR